MRLLLDTHIYLWCIQGNPHLSKDARNMISEADEVYVSSASIWEIAIKINIGKLEANLNKIVSTINDSGFLELPVTAKHASATLQLPNLHRDPFDRMLIAQAVSEPLRLLTADKALKQYSDLIEVI
jgi:PIN domain nuclease of toxin-antitoxin system